MIFIFIFNLGVSYDLVFGILVGFDFGDWVRFRIKVLI